MKVRVFEESKKVDKPLLLKMECSGIDGVQIMAVDENGEFIAGGHLLTLDKDGILLSRDVSEKLGILLNGSNRVQVRNS